MLHIPLVMEHKDFVVVNKPTGVPMHDPTNGICQILNKQLNTQRLHLVHRLDTDTSGCLLLARNPQAAKTLSLLFETRQINKLYLALSDQKPKKKQGKISGDMQKSRGGSYKLTLSSQNPAITFFKSVYFNEANCKNPLLHHLRLFYLKPITGKTHQLRVAMKSLSSPIIGDKRYKGTVSDRLYLHSYSLCFHYNEEDFDISCLPNSGERFVDLQNEDIPAASQLNWPKYQHPSQVTDKSTNKELLK